MARFPRLVLILPVLFAAAPFTTAVAQDAPVAAPAETVQLVTKLALNKRVRVIVGLNTESSGEQMGQTVKSVFNLQTTYDGMVTGVDSEAKTSELEMVFKRVNGNMDNPMMGSFEFDSSDPTKGSDNPMAAQIAGSMEIYIDSKLTTTIGPDAAVTDVKGVDELAEKVISANPMAAMQGDPAESLRTDMQNTFPQLPAAAVGVGSTWKGKRVLDFQGAQFELDVTYKVAAVSAESVDYTGEFEGKAVGGMMGGMITFTDPTGSITGRLSRAHGLPLVEEISVTSTMDTSAMGGGPAEFTLVRKVTVVDPPAGEDKPTTGGADTAQPGPGADDGAQPEDGE